MNVTEIESDAIKWEINTECDYIRKNTTYIWTKAHFMGFYTETNDKRSVKLIKNVVQSLKKKKSYETHNNY